MWEQTSPFSRFLLFERHFAALKSEIQWSQQDGCSPPSPSSFFISSGLENKTRRVSRQFWLERGRGKCPSFPVQSQEEPSFASDFLGSKAGLLLVNSRGVASATFLLALDPVGPGGWVGSQREGKRNLKVMFWRRQAELARPLGPKECLRGLKPPAELSSPPPPAKSARSE